MVKLIVLLSFIKLSVGKDAFNLEWISNAVQFFLSNSSTFLVGWICYICMILASIEMFDCLYADSDGHWWNFFIGDCRTADGEVEYPGDIDVGIYCGYTKGLGYYFNLDWKVSKFHISPLSAIITKWSNILKQFVGKLPTNSLSVFDHFVGLTLKGLEGKHSF